MSDTPFTERYNKVMDEIEKKLRTDARLKTIRPFFTVLRERSAGESRHNAELIITEGKITGIEDWEDSSTKNMTIVFLLEFHVKARRIEDGQTQSRDRALALIDTLCGTINDSELNVSGAALADGPGGVRITNAEWGSFSPPNTNDIVYGGVLEVSIDTLVHID